MKILSVLFFSFLTFQMWGQGIEFFEGSWAEALAEAKKQEKIIFVDAYAVWCGPCKMMSKNVFTDKEVGDFYNANFINVKLDMEKGEGLNFRKKYPVSAFPTLFYIDYSGEVVQKIRGALQSEDFIKAGKAALGKVDRSGEYAEAYENGDRSPELVYNYIKALNQAGKSSLKITNDYLRAQENLAITENYRIIFEGTVEADSRIFEWLIQYQKPIEALFTKQLVGERIIKACEATAGKAIEFRSERLLEEAIDKAEKYAPEYSAVFAAEVKMKYGKETGNAEEFVDACKAYAKTLEKEDRESHILLANDLIKQFKNHEEAKKMAEKLAEKAADGSDNYNHLLAYSSILLFNGKEAKAREAAEKAAALAKAAGDPSGQMRVDRFLQNLR